MCKEQVIELMREKGITISENRIVIVEEVCRMRAIMDVEKFWLDLRAVHKISWATTYNVLRVMSEYGILKRTKREGRAVSYYLPEGVEEQCRSLKG
ncbi:transcriptional repressor [Sphingobacterium sp. LRF_L2]|uniref:transcriptional repressor n=1 Tax=Sphingobacterium sp. LRF_L2 TaxID=3369421 RepID=UPI003F612AE3